MMQRTRSKMIPKVCDFGLGKNLAKEGQTRTGQQMGTPAYMAPEQIRSTKDVDQRADIFSLGAILYELMTGHRAFKASNTLDLLNAVASIPHPPPLLYVADLEDRIVQAIDGALTKNAQFRIPNCATLRKVLLGEQEWAVERPSGGTGQTGGDTLMSLGLDLMGEGGSDTAVNFLQDAAGTPELSSLVSERRVHHGPNSPHSTVVQHNPNARPTTQNSLPPMDLQNSMVNPQMQSVYTEPAPQSNSGKIFGLVGVVALILAGGLFVMSGKSPEPTSKSEAVAETQKSVDSKPQTNSTAPDIEDNQDETQNEAQEATVQPSSKPTNATAAKSTNKAPKEDLSATPTVAKSTPATQTVQTAKVESKKSEAQPVETKPAEVKPVETKPSGDIGSFKFVPKAKAPPFDKAFLRGSDGKTYTTSAPIGSYEIILVCNGKEKSVGKHSVQSGSSKTFECECMFNTCR